MLTFNQAIVKFIFALHLQMSKPQRRHLSNFIHGILLCDGRKTVSQIRHATNDDRDLSCMTRFLDEAPWCPNRATRRRIEFMMKRVRRARAKKGDSRSLTFFIVDDSQSKKNRSVKSMERLDEHFSHADGKTVWSHCVVTSHVVSEGYSFPFDFRPYFRESYCQEHGLVFKSKNDLAIELIRSYQADVDELVYVLTDSWYPSKEMIDACSQKGFHVISAVRSNRKMYPKGIGVKMNTFASQYVESSDLRSVTAEGHDYKVYTYEGPLSGIENTKVLLSWENTFKASKAPFCILCTDTSLDVVTILSYYSVRWHIETGYRYFKDLLGFDQYQLLSYKGIQRFWCIQFLVYNFLEYQRKQWEHGIPMTLGDVVRRIQKEHIGQLVVFAYEQGLDQKPLAHVLESLKLSA